jgi:hypothetical protein
MRQEETGLDPSDCVFHQSCKFLPLFLGNRGTQILDFNQPLAHEDNLGNFVDPGHPGIADELRIKR